MLKKIFAVVSRDFKSGTRDFIIGYIMIAPFILVLILKLLIPGVGSTAVKFAVDNSINSDIAAYLKNYGKVEKLSSYEQVEKRVSKTDDIFGISRKNDKYDIVLQGNEGEEAHELVEYLLFSYENKDVKLPVKIKITDIGWKLSPLKQQGANVLVVFITVFGGMVIALSLVEEKQYKTLPAVNVSAISKFEYIIGKGLTGFIMPIVHSFGILLILGFSSINYLMVTIVVVCTALISIIIGFVIGVLNDNTLNAISSMKTTFIPILASVFGAIFLPEKWLFTLYWSPFYWAYKSIDAIILKKAVWSNIILNCSLIILITAVVFCILSKKIKRGLA